MAISYVVDQAVICCSKGMGQSLLNKSNENMNLELHDKTMIIVADNKVNKNIMPLPVCISEKNPEVLKNLPLPTVCNPIFCSKWTNGKEKFYLNGELALTSDSKLTCIYGGIISIVDDGQRK